MNKNRNFLPTLKSSKQITHSFEIVVVIVSVTYSPEKELGISKIGSSSSIIS